jgi:AraC-like DNA-binding protein
MYSQPESGKSCHFAPGVGCMSSDAYAHNPVTLLHIAARLRTLGISPLDIFRRAGVPPAALLNGNGWVPRDLCLVLGNHAATLSGDKFFGSRIGERFELVELGGWGRVVLGARNLAQACVLASSAIGLLHQGTDLRFVTLRRHAELRFSFRGRLGASPHQHLLGTLVVLRKVALLAGMPEAVGVCLSVPYARHADSLEETYGERLEFGCAQDAIVIDRDILNCPVVTANGHANGLDPSDTAEATAALVREHLPYGHPTLERTAGRLRISIRTLQRRLRDWGFSFEELLDDIRRAEAMRLVLNAEHSAMEIAFLLGYSDHAHFTRAFKRWTGVPPRDYATNWNGAMGVPR